MKYNLGLKFTNQVFLNLKHYWFLILLILVFWYRVDLNCFKIECRFEEKDLYSFVNYKIFQQIRQHSINTIEQNFPSPHSELLLGMTIGIDNLYLVPSFKQALKNTGTIHVVVVSGFNISLVFGTILSILKSKYKYKNLVLAQIITILYCVLTGFEPPIVRALVMGSIVNWATYLGRGINTLLTIVTSAFFIMAIQPLYFFSLSFILSTMATIGLVLISPILNIFIKKLFKQDNILLQDFVSGLSANSTVWPLISYYFGSLSLVGLVANAVILWTVSVTTILGTIFIILSFINIYVASILMIPLFVLTDIFVNGVYFFNNLEFGYYNFKISLWALLLYYVLLFSTVFLISKRIKKFN